MKKTFILLLGILLPAGCAVKPQKLYPDVKISRLIRVIDGDTFVCDIDEHSAIAGKAISIRIRHINTPELHARESETRQLAVEEKKRLESLLTHAHVIELRNLGRDKYFRIDAEIYIDGKPLLPQLNPNYLLLRRNKEKINF